MKNIKVVNMYRKSKFNIIYYFIIERVKLLQILIHVMNVIKEKCTLNTTNLIGFVYSVLTAKGERSF